MVKEELKKTVVETLKGIISPPYSERLLKKIELLKGFDEGNPLCRAIIYCWTTDHDVEKYTFEEDIIHAGELVVNLFASAFNVELSEDERRVIVAVYAHMTMQGLSDERKKLLDIQNPDVRVLLSNMTFEEKILTNKYFGETNT